MIVPEGRITSVPKRILQLVIEPVASVDSGKEMSPGVVLAKVWWPSVNVNATGSTATLFRFAARLPATVKEPETKSLPV